MFRDFVLNVERISVSFVWPRILHPEGDAAARTVLVRSRAEGGGVFGSESADFSLRLFAHVEELTTACDMSIDRECAIVSAGVMYKRKTQESPLSILYPSRPSRTGQACNCPSSFARPLAIKHDRVSMKRKDVATRYHSDYGTY